MDITVTIADNHGIYDEYEVLNFRVSEDGQTVAAAYLDSRGEVAYKITGIENLYAE